MICKLFKENFGKTDKNRAVLLGTGEFCWDQPFLHPLLHVLLRSMIRKLLSQVEEHIHQGENSTSEIHTTKQNLEREASFYKLFTNLKKTAHFC